MLNEGVFELKRGKECVVSEDLTEMRFSRDDCKSHCDSESAKLENNTQDVSETS